MFQYELNYTFTDYSTATRKFKPSSLRKTVKIDADNPITAEKILTDKFIDDAPRRTKREIILTGVCHIVRADGRILESYDFDCAFLVDKTEAK